MKDYRRIISELEEARKGLVDLITLDNYPQVSRVNVNIARVMGVLEAWDELQETKVDTLAAWAKEKTENDN